MAAFGGEPLSKRTYSIPRLFKRDCVKCPEQNPQCPTCEPGTSCTLLAQTCDSCAKPVCQQDQEISSPSTNGAAKSDEGGSSPTGAIIGGVVGGLVVICLIGYLLYRMYKKKREEQEIEFAASMASSSEYGLEKDDSFGKMRDARASTHTVNSIASTVLTRASNVIQIAYIPGVTNRSNPNSPGSIPPVPPLPLSSPSYVSATPGEQQFFSANDLLRNSTYSAVSTIPDRTSVATTIYRNNAVVSPVAATAVRAKAAVVTVTTVKGPSASTSQASSPGLAPPVPKIDFSAYETGATPSSPAFSVGSTFLNKTSAAAEANTPLSEQTLVEDNEASAPGTPATATTAMYLTPAANKRVSKGTMVAPREEDGPFSDRASLELSHMNKRASAVSSVRSASNEGRASPATFREGDIRISLRPMSVTDETPERPKSVDRSKSPFADENTVNDRA